MKERLLLLCMAYPELSKKYGLSVCMAGVTETGEYRRIYPIPFTTFLSFGFVKREWISYEIKEKGDYRKESYKIYPNTMQHGDKEEYEQIREICKRDKTSIETLKTEWVTDRTSLGIIQPKLKGITITKNAPATLFKKQELLNDKRIPFDLLEYSIRYHFTCSDSCNTTHKCLCLDTEVGQLYRNIKKRATNTIEIERKLKDKLFYWMQSRDLYFLMGNHSLHPRSWMCISLLYPKQKGMHATNTLDKWLR